MKQALTSYQAALDENPRGEHGEAGGCESSKENGMVVDIDIDLSAQANARSYYTQKKVSFETKIVFFNLKKYNYTEHLVIYMYILSEATIISSIVTIIAMYFGVTVGTIGFAFVIPFQILYSAFCLKKLF